MSLTPGEEGWEPYPGPAPPGPPLLVRRRVLSPGLRNFRDLIVALPPAYGAGSRRYPVVYMQDGQNLFDPDTSHAGDWGLGPVLERLAARGVEALVVGVANAGRERVHEYAPFRDARLGGGGGDRYLDFLAGTVKPMVDRAFRTDPAAGATAIAGSSMGGLISLYALYRRPDVFGAAAALSPSLWFARQAMLRHAAGAGPPRGRLYLDVGTAEGAGTVADVRALRDILAGAGRPPGPEFDYVEDEAGTHHESAWGRRAGRALGFLLAAREPARPNDGERP
jgi:predicted alpha/beta superfamily hydrolase